MAPVLGHLILKARRLYTMSKEARFSRMNRKELGETGISYSTFRPTNLNQANLNEAWKPISPPFNGHTMSVSRVFQEMADRYALLEAYAHRFFYKAADGEIPYGSNQQSNPNVMLITSRSSFRHDPDNSLQKYPRVYYEYHNGNNPHQFANSRNRNKWQGEPTEFEEMHVPSDNWFKSVANPYAPGGWMQQIFGQRNERDTQIRGANRGTVFASPYGGQHMDR
jgi:hypothetical protein